MQLQDTLFAFSAGVFTIFSPCGFPMLPGYISYYMGSRSSRGAALSGLGCFTGLAAVYLIFGALALLLRSAIVTGPILVSLELVVGLVIIIVGVAMLLDLPIAPPMPSLTAPRKRGFLGALAYGSLYGMVTASCSFPILLSMILYSLVSGGLLQTAVIFLTYVSGMAFPLAITTILVAAAKRAILTRFIGLAAKIHRVSGPVLIAVGIYLIYIFLSTVGLVAPS